MCLEWTNDLEKTKYYVTWPIRGPFKVLVALKYSLLCIITVLANYTDHVKFVLTCTHWTWYGGKCWVKMSSHSLYMS